MRFSMRKSKYTRKKGKNKNICLIYQYQSVVSNSDLPIDPNEPVYCYCQQVSFGEMLACDNDQVKKKAYFFIL